MPIGTAEQPARQQRQGISQPTVAESREISAFQYSSEISYERLAACAKAIGRLKTTC